MELKNFLVFFILISVNLIFCYPEESTTSKSVTEPSKALKNEIKIKCESSVNCTILEYTKNIKFDLNGNNRTKFDKIKFLTVRESKLPHIPKEFGEFFVNLEFLDINGVGLERLDHDDLFKLSKLKTLIASNNSIKTIAKNVFDDNLKLEEIDLSSNKIKMIKTKSIRALKDLKIINLKGNSCIDEKFENLNSDEKERQKNMNKIMIKCKEIKKKDAEDPSIVKKLKKTVMEINPLKMSIG